MEDQIPGGLADEKSPDDFDSEALSQGVKVELEHTDDEGIAEEIAMDHLAEDSNYYTRLELMEEGFSSSRRRARVASKIYDAWRYPEDEDDEGESSFGWDARDGISQDFVGGNS